MARGAQGKDQSAVLGAGQAVQCLNLMLRLDEGAGYLGNCGVGH